MQAVQFAQAVWDMVNQRDVARTVDEVLRSARRFTPAAEAGVYRLHDGRRVEIAGTSGPRAQRADELQLELGEGPCLHATMHSAVCLLADTRSDDRWPKLAPAVADVGWGSVLSLPLVRNETPLGALNLYATGTRSFSDEDVEWAGVLARHASVALGLRITEEGLQRQMADQHLLGQAKGIVMERYGIDRERAQSVLDHHAEATARPLGEVAGQVIATRRLPALEAEGA